MDCPIPDFGVMDDTSLVALVAELQRLLTEDNDIYIHCFGGHGRTGTVCVNLISAVEGIGPAEAMKHLCKCHYYRLDAYSRRCKDCALSDGVLEDADQMKQTRKVEGVMKRQSLMRN